MKLSQYLLQQVGYMVHPTNHLNIKPETLALLHQNPAFRKARKEAKEVTFGRLPFGYEPIRCKPPYCNPFVHYTAVGVEVEQGNIGKYRDIQYCLNFNLDLKNYPKSLYCKNTVAKLWPKELILRTHLTETLKLASYICPKLYKLDIENLALNDQIVYFEELQLFQKVTSLDLWRTKVISKSDDSEVPVTKIIQFFSRLTEFKYRFFDGSIVAQNTVKELMKIQHFFKLKRFIFWEIPEPFDIETFYDYLKKNKLTDILLYFPNQIPHGYKIRLDEITDEIIQCQSHPYKIPFIMYQGMSLEKRNTLSNLAKQQNLQFSNDQ